MRRTRTPKSITAIVCLLCLLLACAAACASDAPAAIGAPPSCTVPGCNHIDINENGEVVPLCALGSYLITQPTMLNGLRASSVPTPIKLESGKNTLYQSGSYEITKGDATSTLYVAAGKVAALTLNGATLSELHLFPQTVANIAGFQNSTLSALSPGGGTLGVNAPLSIGQIDLGALTVTGTNLLTVNQLNAELTAASNNSFNLQYDALGAEAQAYLSANWRSVAAPAGAAFQPGMTAVYNGTTYPLCFQRSAMGAASAYLPLPVPESTKHYEADITGNQCTIQLVQALTAYALNTDSAELAISRAAAASCTLTSTTGATQSARVSGGVKVELIKVQTTGSISVSDAGNSFQLNGANRFNQLIVASGAALNVQGGGTLDLSGLANNGALSISGTGVVQAAGLTGGGTLSVSPQTNLSLPDTVTSLNGGALLPTRIKIVGSGGSAVANQKCQLKLGGGEQFTTTTDTAGFVTLWRSAKLNAVDVVALSGGDTYAAIITNGGADADALPLIKAFSLSETGKVSFTVANAKTIGVQYYIGSASYDMPATYDPGSTLAIVPGGQTSFTIPGVVGGQVVTARLFASKESGAALSAVTTDAFAFSPLGEAVIGEKFKLSKQSRVYNGYAFTFNAKDVPAAYPVAFFDHHGSPLSPGEVVNAGAYRAKITVPAGDPKYAPGECWVDIEIGRRKVEVIAFADTKLKGEPDPDYYYNYMPVTALCKPDEDDGEYVDGRIFRDKGEHYGNYCYTVGSLRVVDAFGRRDDNYYVVLSPLSEYFFINWNARHYIPLDPLSIIDPVYDELHFADGKTLKVQYRTSDSLKLNDTYFGTLVTDTETRKSRPFTPSLRARQGVDEALLILTAESELREDGGYQTDRDGNRLWRGRTLRLGYWHIAQFRHFHVETLAFSLKGVTVMFDLADLLGDGVNRLLKENGLAKSQTYFYIDLIPIQTADGLMPGEESAARLAAGQAPAMRVEAYLENGGTRLDLSPLFLNARLLFDASAILTTGQAEKDAVQDVTETVNGKPVVKPAQQPATGTDAETDALMGLVISGEASAAEQDKAYQLLQQTVAQQGYGLALFRSGEAAAVDSQIVVPYTASEAQNVMYAALMRTSPFLIAGYTQSGLYGLKHTN